MTLHKLSQAKTLGEVGSILMVLGATPSVGGALVIVGLVLTLVAIKYISEIIGDSSIFTDTLIAVVLAAIGAIIAVAVIAASIFSFLTLGFFTGGIARVFVGVIAALAILWVLLILSALFVRKSYRVIALKTKVDMFGTASLLYLIGAALTIVLVGFVLIFVAEILNIISFFSLPDELPQTVQPAQQTA